VWLKPDSVESENYLAYLKRLDFKSERLRNTALSFIQSEEGDRGGFGRQIKRSRNMPAVCTAHLARRQNLCDLRVKRTIGNHPRYRTHELGRQGKFLTRECRAKLGFEKIGGHQLIEPSKATTNGRCAVLSKADRHKARCVNVSEFHSSLSQPVNEAGGWPSWA
jgi:hypothetical protein